MLFLDEDFKILKMLFYLLSTKWWNYSLWYWAGSEPLLLSSQLGELLNKVGDYIKVSTLCCQDLPDLGMRKETDFAYQQSLSYLKSCFQING